MNMLQLFSVGDTIYGYCNGYFGRDDFDTKVCVAVTPLYAVFEWMGDCEDVGKATVLNFRRGFTQELVTKWKNKENET